MAAARLLQPLAALLLAAVALVLAAQPVASQAPAQASAHRNIPAARLASRPVPGRFIVTVQPKDDPGRVAADHGVKPDFVYRHVLNGFAGPMSDLARSGLLRDNRVVRVEQDHTAVITAAANSWGIDRIDQRLLPLNGTYNAPATGAGVTVYVVDTGIRFGHLLFSGRAIRAIDVVNDGRNGSDCNGHGTHVAGTIGGGQGYGVAPGVTLASARVLGCDGSGYDSGIIQALDWIAANGKHPAVVNMSLGGTASPSLDDAVTKLVSSGIPVVVAAGNDTANACNGSPARVPSALTVAASDDTDTRASFSDYGSCVDLFAPGVDILSAYYTANDALAYMSGTSMAAPHVAGRAALILQTDPVMSSTMLNNTVITGASAITIANAAGSPNRLANVQTPAVRLSVTLAAATGYDIARLRWSDVVTTNADIYRNGVKILTTANTGAWNQNLTVRGTYSYKVCNAGSTRCSPVRSVTY